MEDENRINWLGLFIKIVIIFIFALIIVWLVVKIIGRNKLSDTFKNNINSMESVAVEYFKGEDLPLSKGQSKKITLQEMIDKNLILSINKDGSSTCDTKNSYSKITRQKDKYKLETTLRCGKEKDTITRDFSLKDCKNCNQNTSNNSSKDTNSNKNNDNTNSQSDTKVDESKATSDNKAKTTYYEYVKETTTYSSWARGNVTGDNIENKYEYYGIAKDTYYTLGYVKESEIGKTINYTVKLDKVPNNKYYFTTIEDSKYYTAADESKYTTANNVSLVKGKNDNNNNISKYSLGESNFTYKLAPYYRKGSYYVDITIVVNNTTGISSYKDSKLNTNIYYLPIKLDIKFASNEITTNKPSGDYETITYYRYVGKNKETKWSTESSLEGYTKTGNTKSE